MKIKSALATQMSGSLGGLVASHNRGGIYLRARSTPVNPNTARQQAIRGFVAQLSNLWLSTLTAVQRGAWDTYAFQVPLPDRLGEPRNVGGLAMYIRSNVPRLQVALPRVDAAPTIFNLGDYTTPILTDLSEAEQRVTVTFAILDEWVNEDDAAMLFYASPGVNASINFYKGPFQQFSQILGDLAVPPVSPLNISGMRPFVEAQRMYFRVNVTRADGRLGTSEIITASALAAVGASEDAAPNAKAKKRRLLKPH